ncbi:MAG TPA: hypothetical protein VMW27_16925 [Thermoanaerobaculia bacterium]|nr:hypothetical protein [Thermoanaerobaculia bacterium]
MPEPDDSTPAVAVPPILNPDEFEEETVFRETFLFFISDPEANDVLRRLGRLLFALILEFWGYWPNHPEGLIRTQLRAVSADMRHTQGYLAAMSRDSGHMDEHERHLCRLAGAVSRAVAVQADRIDQELGKWRGEGVEP